MLNIAPAKKRPRFNVKLLAHSGALTTKHTGKPSVWPSLILTAFAVAGAVYIAWRIIA